MRQKPVTFGGKARATVERLADLRIDEPTNVVRIEDAVAKWKREADEQTERLERERRERTIAQIERRLVEQIAETIDARLLDQHDTLIAIVGEALGTALADERAEFEKKIAERSAQLDTEILSLRSLIAELRTEVANATDRGVVTLPSRRA